MARTSLETTSSKAPAGKPASKGGGGTLERAQLIKLGVSVGVIVLVTVWLLYSMEIISFGGGSNEPEVTPAEQQAFEEQAQRDAAARERAERDPTAPRPPPVGSQ